MLGSPPFAARNFLIAAAFAAACLAVSTCGRCAVMVAIVAALVADTADAGVVLVVLVVLETAIFYEVRLDPTDYSKGASRQCMHNSCQKDWHELFMLFDLLTRYYRFVA